MPDSTSDAAIDVDDELPGKRERLAEALRDETIGGILLLIAAVVAVVWANSPWSASYEQLSTVQIGPQLWHLNLTVSTWAADGLLAVFFFVAGLELKYELVLGSLRRASTAAVPVVAALGGMIVPALIYWAINVSSEQGEPTGWGIPMATDIAFALAVLAVAGRNLPTEARVFLLTLAVVDDLGSIFVIAIFYTEKISLLPLLGAMLAMAAYWFAQRQRIRTPALYLPLAAATWILVHSSGVHATVAGICLGLLTRVKPDPGEDDSPAERLIHRVGPISAGVCVPLFALFSAGVNLQGQSISEALTHPVTIGIIVALVVGKPIGVIGGAWIVTKVSKARISDALKWGEIVGLGLVAGVGFTVSLLISELAFEELPVDLTDAKLAILIASVVSAIIASAVLLWRGHKLVAQAS
ncbi:MAG: Na+/H+ antiporter NhaA [Actinomycetes bacterium]